MLAGLFATAAHAGSNHTLEIRSGSQATSYSGDLSAIDQLGNVGMIVFVADGAIEYPVEPAFGSSGMRPTGHWSADVLTSKGWVTIDGCALMSITLLADHSHIRLVCP